MFTLIGTRLSRLDATRSSTIITLGRPSPNEVARVTNESALEFVLLGICFIGNTSKLDCSCFTWLRYHFVLWSFALNYPVTCPTMSLESQNTSMALPPSFFIAFKPARKASYSVSLFVVEKPNCKDFFNIDMLGGNYNYSYPRPFWLEATSM